MTPLLSMQRRTYEIAVAALVGLLLFTVVVTVLPHVVLAGNGNGNTQGPPPGRPRCAVGEEHSDDQAGGPHVCYEPPGKGN